MTKTGTTFLKNLDRKFKRKILDENFLKRKGKKIDRLGLANASACLQASSPPLPPGMELVVV
jgi:hypothetical protein